MHAKSFIALLVGALLPAAFAAPTAIPDGVAICPDTTGTLTVHSLSVAPKPVTAGQDVTITASGIVNEAIEEGAKAVLTLTAGVVELVKSEIDLCQTAVENGKSCPIPVGPRDIALSRTIPPTLPKGTYQVKIDAINASGNRIICFTGPLEVA